MATSDPARAYINRRSRPSANWEDLLANAMMSRSELLSQVLDPRRSIEDECGYPNSSTSGYINPDVYQQLYDREAVAARVVEVLPRESWQIQPTVYEKENVNAKTPFEIAWRKIGKQLSGYNSYYQEEKGSCIWEYLRRADEQSGIGHYGALLLGVDDGGELSSPLSFVELEARDKPVRKLLFLRAFPESLAYVTQYDSNPNSPRFGQPIEYLITFNDPRDQQGGIGLTTATVNVHWTRIIHLADNLGSSEVFGIPRMRPVLNRLLDLRKLYSGSAEMYWRGAFPGYTLETHPQLGGDVEVDEQKVKDMMENYMNGLQRYLVLMGMSLKGQPPQVVSPVDQINVQIEAICIKLGIPVRVFKGSERGELASSQDDAAWNDRLRERQYNYITPRIIVPFIDRLIALGVLPPPEEEYYVAWPGLASQTDQEKSQVAMAKTQSFVQYIQGEVWRLIPPMDYLTRVGGFTETEAKAIMENIKKLMKSKDNYEDLITTTQERKVTQEEDGIKQRVALRQSIEE